MSAEENESSEHIPEKAEGGLPPPTVERPPEPMSLEATVPRPPEPMSLEATVPRPPQPAPLPATVERPPPRDGSKERDSSKERSKSRDDQKAETVVRKGQRVGTEAKKDAEAETDQRVETEKDRGVERVPVEGLPAVAQDVGRVPGEVAPEEAPDLPEEVDRGNVGPGLDREIAREKGELAQNLPEKEINPLWDKAPTGFEGMNVAQVAQLNPTVLMPLLSTTNPQQTRQARRLYVGNVPDESSEQELMDFFNTAMMNAGVELESVGPPVTACQLNREKSFAFLEFTSIEDCSTGMALDGITLQGQSLKVRRPKDYQPPTVIVPEEDDDVHIAGIVSTNVPDSPNKIFIGGLPAYLNEEQVKELLSSFGPLKSFNLVKDSETGNSKGYAFFEYLHGEVTDRACEGLNGMKLGDKTLLVQRANIGAKEAMDPNSAAVLGLQNLSSPTAANFLNMSIPAATLLSGFLVGSNDVSNNATRILLLLNLLRVDQLISDIEYKDVADDIRQECETHGEVVSMCIPRPFVAEGRIDHLRPVNGVGKVFVEYKTVEEAKKAQQNLAGRRFQGRTVLTSYYDEEEYANKDFSVH
eukprot:CAMPEP_0174277460 /NCGR_PEP_ID=MMETSP0439-20130205/60942_1 /TAXON_ID=0 /ORGANISM="Stereomyxa ramosa, Strain Chinc5" /LENGTH=584 /DNA_ID=CAMNT_0015369783 /DNA_START=24 /DNA_END=1778 /DNA_ORIENTATION=+